MNQTPPNYSDLFSPSDPQTKIKDLSEIWGYSPFMITQIMQHYPTEYVDVIRAFSTPPIETIRTNTLKITPADLKSRLSEKRFRLSPAKWFDYAFDVESSNNPLKLGATHEYLLGYYYLQSLASMVPVHILYPEPGDCVLDMCAAPGSKTTQIGQYMKQQGTIIATDNKTSRIPSLTYNIRRCGIQNCLVFSSDATQIRQIVQSTFKPTKILLDAPCSGSGIARVDPHVKKIKNEAEIKRHARLQKDLLKAGLDMLPVGGRLLYSTCSFLYHENEQVIAEVMHEKKNFEIIEPTENIGLPGFDRIGPLEFGYDLLKTRRLDPVIHNTDAFFFALLSKIE